jgi:plastocyanin
VPIVAVLALAVVPLLAGCGSSSSSGPSTEPTSTESSGEGGGGQKNVAGVDANNHGTETVSPGKRTEVELDDFYFKPTVLQGKPGEKVELELKNEGSTEHTFTIDSQGINKDLGPGEETEVTVMVPRSGVVSFYCKFHKSQGMAGGLAAGGAATSMPGSGTMTNQTTTGGYMGY